MEGISFSYLVFNLLNNLIWLAYAEKVSDRNMGIPSFIGKFKFKLHNDVTICSFLRMHRLASAN